MSKQGLELARQLGTPWGSFEPLALGPIRRGYNKQRYDGESSSNIIWMAWLGGYIQVERPDSDSLAILEASDIKPARGPHELTPEEAVRIVFESIEKSRDLQPAAFKSNIRSAEGEELPFLYFNEIDATIFSGVLKGNVNLCWSDTLPNSTLSMTSRPRSSQDRIMLELSIDLLELQDGKLLLATLLHQMIHAFLLQCCGPTHAHDLLHGEDFSAIAFVVQHVLGMPRNEYPALMGCTLAPLTVHPHLAPCWLPRQPFAPSGVGQRFTKSRTPARGSACHQGNKGIEYELCKALVRRVVRTTSLPKLTLEERCARDNQGHLRPLSQYLHIHESDNRVVPVLRTEYDESPSDFIEIHYQCRAYPIPRKKLPCPAPASPVVLPEKVDNHSFVLLYEYLMSGSYGPPYFASPFIITSDPPPILAFQPWEKPFFLPNVQAYRLGTVLVIPALQRTAMQRLEKPHRPCIEDPIAVLEMLYHGTQVLSRSITEDDEGKSDGAGKDESLPPDKELRDWAKKWLKAPNSKPYASNLDVLRRHDMWKTRWARLREMGKGLVADVDAVDIEIAEEKEKKETKKKKEDTQGDGNEWSMKVMQMALKSAIGGAQRERSRERSKIREKSRERLRGAEHSCYRATLLLEQAKDEREKWIKIGRDLAKAEMEYME